MLATCLTSLWLPPSPLQVEAVSSLVKGVNETVLHNSLKADQKKHPDAPLEERLARVARRIVPPTVPGSPQYHRAGLEDLLAMVNEHGMPTLFMTLTADEASEMRWPEVAEFEALCNKMGFRDDWTWRDMPVEMGTLFHERVQHFMKAHVLDKSDPILGKVLHYTVRYESQVGGRLLALPARPGLAHTKLAPIFVFCLVWNSIPTASPIANCIATCRAQHRGSLHAHILLWLDPEDTDRVASEITATMCKWAPDDNPADPECPYKPDVNLTRTNNITEMGDAERLYRLVKRKNTHKCRNGEHGCRRDNHPQCRYGFPAAPNHKGTHLDPATQR